jgi:hypothetical protein
MKDAGWIVAALLFGIMIGFGIGTWYAKPAHEASPMRTAAVDNRPAPAPITADTNRPPSATEWQGYHTTREKALHDNPALAAEYKDLLAEVNQHQADVEAAMVKADPKVAPIVAKLTTMREHNMAQVTASMK